MAFRVNPLTRFAPLATLSPKAVRFEMLAANPRPPGGEGARGTRAGEGVCYSALHHLVHGSMNVSVVIRQGLQYAEFLGSTESTIGPMRALGLAFQSRKVLGGDR
jgi:hypothetical protein